MLTIQICGIIILGIIIYFSAHQNRLRLNTNNAYVSALITTAVILVIDVIGILSITNRDKIPPALLRFICKIFLVALNVEGICGIMYTLVSVLSYRQMKKINKYVVAYTVVISTIILISPIKVVYFESKKIMYTVGLACDITYLVVGIAIVSTLLVCLKYKNALAQGKFKAIVTWVSIWIITALIQFFNKEILAGSFGCALGIMVMYFQLENPEKFIDADTGYFNQQAFYAYIKQMYSEEKKFSLLMVCDSNDYSRLELTEEEIRQMRERYMTYIRQFSRLTFLYEHDKAILVFYDAKKCNDALNQIIEAGKEEFKGENEFIKPMLYTLYDSTIVNSRDQIITLINYSLMNLSPIKDKNNYANINIDTLNSLNNENNVVGMIHRAIKEDKILVYYQPIYSTSEKRVTSAEALVRIEDDEGNIVLPGAFIEIAEKTNLILKIGQIVFKKVCRFISENDMEKLGLDYIEINLSVVQCAYQSLALEYKKIINEYGIDTKYINLEITETGSIESRQILLDNMSELRKSGISFSLDDFGTGNSNLNYIMDMPVDIVKFDKEMTKSYFKNEKSQYIMDAAMHMIKGLKLKIVAEGIETEYQFNTMNNLGIDYIQGYYFSKPIPEDEFIEFVMARHNVPT